MATKKASNSDKKHNQKKSEKPEEIIYSEEEIEKDVEKKHAKKKDNDEEPSWYHYAIIIGTIIGLFAIAYIGFELFYPNEEQKNSNLNIELHEYKYKIGNVTYVIPFHSKVTDIIRMDYPIEPDKYDIYNTIRFNMSFYIYDGNDTGYITVASSKLTNFLKKAFHMNFDTDSFNLVNESNCSTSNNRNKVIIFEINETNPGVFLDEESGCIRIVSTNNKEMINVTDKFIFELTQ